MKRWDIINHLIKKYGYSDYLEIGVRDGGCFEKVVARNKTGVDPNPVNRANYYCIKKTSDEFFADNQDFFDIIFIDGLHLADQVINDISNALMWLKDEGTIVVHDCNPLCETHQLEEYNGGVWNGTVWKAWVQFRRADWLTMYTVDTDYGCGIIQYGGQIPLELPEEMDWEYFRKNRSKLLDLVSVENFLSLMR